MMMKRLLWLLMALLLSNTAFALDTDIRNINPSCDSSGNLNFVALISGRAIETPGIMIYATHNETKQTVNLTGYWEVEGNNVSLIVPPGNDLSQAATFHSTNGKLSKNGIYLGVLSFFQAKTDLYPSKVSFYLACPGADCLSDSQCNYDETCNQVTKKCNYLSCNKCEIADLNRCVPKCSSGDPCIKNNCDVETGACSIAPVKSCCKTDSDCDDRLSCTTDKCNGNKCEHEYIKCNAAKGSCVVGACIEPNGCVYTTNQSCIGGLGEKRDYMIVIGEPKVVKKPLITRIAEWLSDVLGGIARSFF